MFMITIWVLMGVLYTLKFRFIDENRLRRLRKWLLAKKTNRMNKYEDNIIT